MLHPPQFRQPPQPSDRTIAGIARLVEIIQHLVAVIGPHRQRDTPARLHRKQFADHRYHIDIPSQMIGLEEITCFIRPGAAQMDEMNMIPQPPDHPGEIIVGTNPIGTRAET